jgi:hypothetical protein
MAVFYARGAAQTTRADGDVSLTWAKQVSSIAAAAAAHDSQGLQALVDPDCKLRRFSSDGSSDINEFVDFATNTAVLGDHAYVFPAQGVAADIARDIESSSLVTNYQRKQLAMGDPGQKPGAVRWLAQSLEAQDGDLIGVIVLWDSRDNIDDMHRPNFILIKGEKDGDQFKATQIVFGDPLE